MPVDPQVTLPVEIQDDVTDFVADSVMLNFEELRDAFNTHTHPGGTGSVFEFDQPTPATTWVIVHNLGFHPNVAIRDTAGTVIWGEVKHDSANQVTATFSAPFSGKATLS